MPVQQVEDALEELGTHATAGWVPEWERLQLTPTVKAALSACARVDRYCGVYSCLFV